MLQSLLVALDGSVYSDAAATLAIDWARRHEARIVAVGVVDAPAIQRAEPVPVGAGAYKRARDEARMADAHHRVAAFLGGFEARSRAAGVPAEVLEDIGDPAARILHEAERCDVVVLARETHFHFETQDRPDETLAQILRRSPRPVVVAPRDLLDERRGVLVACGGGRESARALQTFQLLGLAAGEAIQIVTIHADAAEAGAIAGHAGRYLAAQGAVHRLHPVVSSGDPAGILLEEIRRARPRLVVMGAHGHHPIRDLFTTSVTRAVLRACPVPVFVGA
jgi:nucleotide-binding universal stress UspA family protein